jgi:hypothetical protein
MPLTPEESTLLTWRKSSASLGGGACVEVAPYGDGVALRHSKDPHGPVLVYTAAEWTAFVNAIRSGEFDEIA